MNKIEQGQAIYIIAFYNTLKCDYEIDKYDLRDADYIIKGGEYIIRKVFDTLINDKTYTVMALFDENGNLKSAYNRNKF